MEMTIVGIVAMRRLGTRFVPMMAAITLVLVTITAGMPGSRAFGQENGDRTPIEPKLLSTVEILGGLGEQTELFNKLSVSSAYNDADSYLTVEDRRELETQGPASSDFPKNYTWMTPGTYHHPLYFEQVNLERYGTGVHPVLQPAFSAAHFFTTIPILPYKMGSQCPTSKEYSLGHYRPGDCTPHQCHHRSWSWRGAGVMSGPILAAP